MSAFISKLSSTLIAEPVLSILFSTLSLPLPKLILEPLKVLLVLVVVSVVEVSLVGFFQGQKNGPSIDEPYSSLFLVVTLIYLQPQSIRKKSKIKYSAPLITLISTTIYLKDNQNVFFHEE